jgi:hypothetical protein
VSAYPEFSTSSQNFDEVHETELAYKGPSPMGPPGSEKVCGADHDDPVQVTQPSRPGAMQNDVEGHETEMNAWGPSVVFLITGADHDEPLKVSRKP